MTEPFAPLFRHFSAIEGLQRPYTLIYAMEPGDLACQLTVCRTGQDNCCDSVVLSRPPQQCYSLLRYLYENAVQPEIWRDIITEICAPAEQRGKGGVPCEG